MGTHESRDTRARFEQWARNASCEANTISAVRGIRMAEVAVLVGLKATMGQSPFALAGGTQFEHGLFKDDAKRLFEQLETKEVLPKGAQGFADLRTRKNGGKLKDLDEAIDRTRELLVGIAERPSAAPAVVAAATLRIPGNPMIPEAVLVLDVLAVRKAEKPPSLLVGEIKTYPDRGGYTERGDLATARAQAGVYVHGLEIALAELKLTERLAVSRQGFLVLRSPRGYRPSVRPEELQHQAERAKRGFAKLHEAAKKVGVMTDAEAIQAIVAAGVHYEPACVSFCDLAPRCYKNMLDCGNPSVLGEDVARFLGPIALPRAIELIEGAKSSNDVERDFVRRVAEARGEVVS